MPSNGSDKSGQRLARKARRQEDKREAILTAAREILGEVGFDGLTIPKVAARANLTKPAVYYYFDSKEALMERLVIHYFQVEGRLLMDAIKAESNGLAALKALMTAKVYHYLNQPEIYRIVYVWPQHMTLAPETIKGEMYPIGNEVNEYLEALLAADQEAGLLSKRVHPRRLANLAWFSAQGLLSMVIQIQAMGADTRYGVQQLLDEYHTLLDHTALGLD